MTASSWIKSVLKECSKCKTEKPLIKFYKCNDGVGGVRGDCIICCKLFFAGYRRTHKEFLKTSGKEYRARPDVQKKTREYNKKYRPDYVLRNRNRISANALANQKKRIEIDPAFKLLIRLRSRVYSLLKNVNHRKIKSTLELLGCSADDFKKYLESKFVQGMTWENYNLRGWHVDHIIPCARFNLMNEEELKRCFHFSNLQPMWAKENWSKGARYEGSYKLLN